MRIYLLKIIRAGSETSVIYLKYLLKLIHTGSEFRHSLSFVELFAEDLFILDLNLIICCLIYLFKIYSCPPETIRNQIN